MVLKVKCLVIKEGYEKGGGEGIRLKEEKTNLSFNAIHIAHYVHNT